LKHRMTSASSNWCRSRLNY